MNREERERLKNGLKKKHCKWIIVTQENYKKVWIVGKRVWYEPHCILPAHDMQTVSRIDDVCLMWNRDNYGLWISTLPTGPGNLLKVEA